MHLIDTDGSLQTKEINNVILKCRLFYAYIYIYVSHACLVPKEARRGVRFPGTRVITSCESTWWVLEIEPQSSERRVRLLVT